MQFATTVELPTKELSITHRDRLLLMGSCFTRNIGDKLLEKRFKADINPFGILYNPLSIAEALRRILDGKPFEEGASELVFHQERWHSMLHHSDFSRRSLSDTLSAINDRLLAAHRQMASLDFLIITFGTAYVYRRCADNIVVGNCHKLPASDFNRALLGIEEISDAMQGVMEILTTLRPGVKIVFTVSPIRHLHDGAHDNQVSKATLLLAIEEIRKRFPDNTAYFPAYEIVLDELRDYRFYADDMTHPSSLAIEYIWECFKNCYFDNNTRSLCKEIKAINSALAHRPFDELSQSYRSFINDTMRRIETIREREPHIDFKNDILKCNILLNK